MSILYSLVNIIQGIIRFYLALVVFLILSTLLLIAFYHCTKFLVLIASKLGKAYKMAKNPPIPLKSQIKG